MVSALDLEFDYGLPGKPGYTYDRPFDYFQFEFAALSGTDTHNWLEIILVRGMLWGRDFELGDRYAGISSPKPPHRRGARHSPAAVVGADRRMACRQEKRYQWNASPGKRINQMRPFCDVPAEVPPLRSEFTYALLRTVAGGRNSDGVWLEWR